jgi:hypothetical protein
MSFDFDVERAAIADQLVKFKQLGNSTSLFFTDAHYDESDYIRNHSEFISWTSK